MHEEKLNWSSLGVPLFYRESQKDKHYYGWSSTSFPQCYK